MQTSSRRPLLDGEERHPSLNCVSISNGAVSVLECAPWYAAQSPPRLLRGEAPRKRGPGGSKDARDSIDQEVQERSIAEETHQPTPDA